MSFIFNQKVLFKHCDPAGIVFYPRYFEMINDCVEMFFYEIGMPFEDVHNSGAVPTVQISTTFQKPSRHGDQLVISLDVTRVGGSSLDLSIQAFCADERRFSTKSTLVYVSPEGRSQKWPDAIRDAFSPYIRSNT